MLFKLMMIKFYGDYLKTFTIHEVAYSEIRGKSGKLLSCIESALKLDVTQKPLGKIGRIL